jgi:hypothetical protein
MSGRESTGFVRKKQSISLIDSWDEWSGVLGCCGHDGRMNRSLEKDD